MPPESDSELSPSSQSAAQAANKSGSVSTSASTESNRRSVSFVSGEGASVTTSSGVVLLDCVSKDAILGHNNEAARAAPSTQSLATNVGQVHSGTLELTRRLGRYLPSTLSTCFFVNSASEANDLALAMASMYGEEIIGVEKASHGTSSSLNKLSREKPLHKQASASGMGTSSNAAVVMKSGKRYHVVASPDTLRGKFRERDFPKDVGWMYFCTAT